MPTSRYPRHLGILVVGVLLVAAVQPSRAATGRRPSPGADLDVVAAVNALVQADIGIAAAVRTNCALDRLPGSRAALLPLVPSDHRRLIEECARGRTRIRRAARDFDLLGLIDDPAARPAATAAVRAFFSTRVVDVATGTGLSAGPYPIRFDWVVVLDPRSRTLVSFVINCRD